MAAKANAPKIQTKVSAPKENKAKAKPKAKAKTSFSVQDCIDAALDANPTRRATNLLKRAAKAQQEGR